MMVPMTLISTTEPSPFDCVSDRSVNFSEDVAEARHIICGAGVEVPALYSLIVASCTEVGFRLQLIYVKR